VDPKSATGVNPELVKSLPFPPGPQREVIMQKGQRYRFDQQVTTCGVKIIDVVTPEDMERAINKNTVMALFKNNDPEPEFHTTITREQFVAICKKHNVPSMIDAAADVPPVTNLFKFQKMGFDLITFSGGKMIRGPQSAGLLFGRKDLIEAAKQNHSPNESPIGRPCKVNKEEIFGMYVALKSYIERDHEKEWQEWLNRIDRIATKVESAVPTVKHEIRIPPPTQPANNYPSMVMTWDQTRVKITPEQVSAALKNGTPAILAGGRGNALNVSVILLEPEQVDIVAKRIKEILEGAVQKMAKT
jgi:seryl-tRNA(Sec) selenium transferase